jgi:hypothetical protein
MITHTSSNRYNNLLTQIQWWNGPTDVAIYINKQDDIHRLTNFLRESESDLTTTTFHIVMEKTHRGYPHNILRNLVLEHLKSDYFVAMDADFVTSPNAHKNLSNLIRNQEGVRPQLQKKKLYVLPAFELLAPNGTDSPAEDMLPRTKDQVRERLGNGTMLPFHAEWHGHTPYWKDFRGFGYNKWSWFYEIHRAGYQFLVLQEFWVAHLNHPIQTRKNLKASNVNKPSFVEYEKYLKSFYDKYHI